MYEACVTIIIYYNIITAITILKTLKFDFLFILSSSQRVIVLDNEKTAFAVNNHTPNKQGCIHIF